MTQQIFRHLFQVNVLHSNPKKQPQKTTKSTSSFLANCLYLFYTYCRCETRRCDNDGPRWRTCENRHRRWRRWVRGWATVAAGYAGWRNGTCLLCRVTGRRHWWDTRNSAARPEVREHNLGFFGGSRGVRKLRGRSGSRHRGSLAQRGSSRCPDTTFTTHTTSPGAEPTRTHRCSLSARLCATRQTRCVCANETATLLKRTLAVIIARMREPSRDNSLNALRAGSRRFRSRLFLALTTINQQEMKHSDCCFGALLWFLFLDGKVEMLL